MDESVDGGAGTTKVPPPAANDSDMQDMIWSDNPERSYFKQLMEDEQMGRVFDGKSMDDSVLGNSTVASLMRDHYDDSSKPDYYGNTDDEEDVSRRSKKRGESQESGDWRIENINMMV